MSLTCFLFYCALLFNFSSSFILLLILPVQLSHLYNLLGITVRSFSFLCFKMFIKENCTTPWKIKPPQIIHHRREVQFGQTSVTRAVEGGHIRCSYFITNPNWCLGDAVVRKRMCVTGYTHLQLRIYFSNPGYRIQKHKFTEPSSAETNGTHGYHFPIKCSKLKDNTYNKI